MPVLSCGPFQDYFDLLFYCCLSLAGFTEDRRGRNHRFTTLLDAHPFFEADVRDYLERKLMPKKGTKLTVASFAAHLNTVLTPSHEDKDSRLADLTTFPSRVPHTSNPVAWR
jgi:hypothetical protein